MSSYPKGERTSSDRRSKARKRSFHGNRFTTRSSSSSKERNEPDNPSESAKKLSSSTSENVTVNPLHYYRLIEFCTVFTTLSDILICRNCKQDVKFEETGIRGLGFKLVIKCTCGTRKINSGPLINTGFEVNRRIVFVMQLLGVSRQGLNLFCNYMDIGSGISEETYNRIYDHIYNASKKVFEYCCKKAVEEEKEENRKRETTISHVKVSGDGETWKKRRFKSLFGVTTLIGYYSEKVIDLVVKSSYCHSCTFWKNKPKDSEKYLAWKEDHDEESCTNTHKGSAGDMEVEAMKMMFLRSKELYGVKYCNYIGDGDSKTFAAILNLNPYGDEFPVVKSECVGHVQKGMGSRLRNVRKADKLGGKGKLTETLVKDLTNYYGLAIRRNVNSVEDMKKAIMATYFHKQSTDENPKHDNCPEGVDSWCKWQCAKALGTESEKHPAPLHPTVQKAILSTYEGLSREDLLTRCLGGHTQNANESFNSTIWRLAPKHLHCGLKVVEVAAFLATALFNEGNSPFLMIMNELEIVVGRHSFGFAEKMDEHRISRQNRRSQLESKEARKARKEEMIAQNIIFEDEEGLLYGAGIAN